MVFDIAHCKVIVTTIIIIPRCNIHEDRVGLKSITFYHFINFYADCITCWTLSKQMMVVQYYTNIRASGFCETATQIK